MMGVPAGLFAGGVWPVSGGALMNMGRKLRLTGLFVVLGVISQDRIQGVQETFYGEPVELKSNFIYFTSWKYVRQGAFTWKVEYTNATTEAERRQGAWLKGDGDKPARFTTVDMPRGIRLVAQKAEKIPYRPGQLAAQVYDQGKYKSWYTIQPCPDPESFSSKDKIMPGHNGHVCYAESEDSVTWHIPQLRLYEYAGNRNNNVVFRGDLNGSVRGFHGGSVFVDPSSNEERYKMFYLGQITDEEWEAFAEKYPGEADTMARRRDVGGYRCVQAVFGAVSPDGIHWNSLPEPLMIQHADTLNTCYYDVDLKQYVAYIRVWEVNPRISKYTKGDPDSWITVGRRSIGRSLSKDFRHFSKPEIVFSTGADMQASHLWYTNGKTTLPGCPDNHVMFPWLWELESDGGAVWLLSSSTGAYWSKVPGGPVVDTGAVGRADGIYIVCSGNLLEYPGNKWGISYSGQPIPHKYPGRDISKRKGLFQGLKGVSGLATWPRGRLVALQCDEEGEFATVSVMPPGKKIRLNASVKPTGYIKVAVRLYGAGTDVPGRSFENTDRMIGDSLAMPVTWNGEANLKHDGAPISLRFQLKQVRLFDIEFY
ncbi:MAG: hypothetical protein JSV03_09550 [Planctomycetota bacterium]|nr:MAG: hypothetical protein JSV03_09550 [Planctomycetota bacterium]